MLGSKHPYLAPLTVILSIQENHPAFCCVCFLSNYRHFFGIAATIFIIKHSEVNGWTNRLLLTIGMVLPVVLRLQDDYSSNCSYHFISFCIRS